MAKDLFVHHTMRLESQAWGKYLQYLQGGARDVQVEEENMLHDSEQWLDLLKV